MKKDSKTLVTAQPTFSSDGSIAFTAPRSWRELTQTQLHYVLFLLSTFSEPVVVKTCMFFRFCGIRVLKKDRFGWMCRVAGRDFTISAAQVESLLGQFDYINSYDDLGVRLDDIDGHHAVDVSLHGVRFIDYLNAEKFYQLFQQTQDDAFVERLACVLYRDDEDNQPDSLKLGRAEMLGTIVWFAWVKDQLSTSFPHFFKPSADSNVGAGYDIVESMNVQIRALTDGDVTKEEQICNTDCWRALTELDFKAKEAEEFNNKMKKP